jgi:lipopolysaccharide/colanic/teichoic acid biosynthesis glycosyltransferase
MERTGQRPPDVARAAERLQRPRARFSLALKRGFDVAVALAMLVALVPLIAVVALLLLAGQARWLEPRDRLGRDGRTVRLWRFRRPPGTLGRALERIGAREVPVLVAVAGGGMSLVGPRALAPDAGSDGPRGLMAPGLIGPAQRWATNAATAAELDDAYVEAWSLLGDFKLLLGVCGGRPAPVGR